MKTLPIDTARPPRRARKRLKTEQHLCATAMKLFEVHGYDGVTMEQIAEAADVAKGTLYNYFPVKEALVARWVHSEIEQDIENIIADIDRQPDFVGRMEVLLATSQDWCEKHREYLPAYLRFRFTDISRGFPSRQMQTLDGIGWAFAHLIERAQGLGDIRNDIPAHHLAELFSHLYLGALMRWLATPQVALRDEFKTVLDIFCRGVSR